jgi:hypothetical protein
MDTETIVENVATLHHGTFKAKSNTKKDVLEMMQRRER